MNEHRHYHYHLSSLITFLLLTLLHPNHAFTIIERPKGSAKLPRVFALKASSSNKDENGEDDIRNSMRFLLEKSWNENTMGIVPKSPEMAAQAAAKSVYEAMCDEKRILLVDIHMSDYDISCGEQSYDETLAVEFCVKLAQELKDLRSEDADVPIVLKNERSRRVVERILNARLETVAVEEEEDIPSKSMLEEDGNDVDENDDSNQENEVSPEQNDDEDIDAFRRQLMSNWESSEGSVDQDDDLNKEDSSDDVLIFNDFDDFEGASDQFFQTQEADTPASINEDVVSKDSNEVDSESIHSRDNVSDGSGVINSKNDKSKGYRLISLLGDTRVRENSADILDTVNNAVDEAAIREIEDDDVAIILSSSSKEEMLAVRRLVSMHGFDKTLIFVNAKLDPIPIELVRAKYVVSYSFMPLIAQNQDDPDASIKIVVLRRYPARWEIYIDAGVEYGDDGFQFVESIPEYECLGSQGPPTQYILNQISKYMEFKSKNT